MQAPTDGLQNAAFDLIAQTIQMYYFACVHTGPYLEYFDAFTDFDLSNQRTVACFVFVAPVCHAITNARSSIAACMPIGHFSHLLNHMPSTRVCQVFESKSYRVLIADFAQFIHQTLNRKHIGMCS